MDDVSLPPSIVETMSQNILCKLSHLTHLKPELASNFENIKKKNNIMSNLHLDTTYLK